MRLSTSTTVVAVGSRSVRVLTPRGSVIAEDLDDRALELVAMWAGALRPDSAALVGLASGHARSRDTFERLADAVDALQSVAGESTLPARRASGTLIVGDCAEGRAAAPTSARRTAGVAIVGSGRLGMMLARLLASADIGSLHLQDDELVSLDDVGPWAHTIDDVGRRRSAAATDRIGADFPRVTVTAGPGTSVDLAVLLAPRAATAAATARLVCEGVPHLGVSRSGMSTQIGPVVVPGVTACLNCLRLHTAGSSSQGANPSNIDATQPVAQASTGDIRISDACVAAHAAQEVLAAIDRGCRPSSGQSSRSESSSVVIDLASLASTRVPWRPHDDCGCRNLDRSVVDGNSIEKASLPAPCLG